jgi:hypothetical protein
MLLMRTVYDIAVGLYIISGNTPFSSSASYCYCPQLSLILLYPDEKNAYGFICKEISKSLIPFIGINL